MTDHRQRKTRWLVIFEMDDYDPSIHEHLTKEEALQDWNENKGFREGQKCIAKVLYMDGDA